MERSRLWNVCGSVGVCVHVSRHNSSAMRDGTTAHPLDRASGGRLEAEDVADIAQAIAHFALVSEMQSVFQRLLLEQY